MLLIHTKICPVIYSLRHVLLKDRKKTPQECSPKLAPPFETLQKRSSCKKKWRRVIKIKTLGSKASLSPLLLNSKSNFENRAHPNTLFEIFIFCPEIQLWFPKKIVDFFGRKTNENVVVLQILGVDNFDFTRKIVEKNLGWKTVKMLGFCQNWISGQKVDFSNSVPIRFDNILIKEPTLIGLTTFWLKSPH